MLVLALIAGMFVDDIDCPSGQLAPSDPPFVRLVCDAGTQLIALPDVGVAPDQLAYASKLYGFWLAGQPSGRRWRLGSAAARNRFGDLTSDLVDAKGSSLQQELVAAGVLLPSGSDDTSFWSALDTAYQHRPGVWADAQAGASLFARDDQGGNIKRDVPHRLFGAAMGRWAYVWAAVRSVGDSRTALYVNFGSSWRDDLTVLIPKSVWRHYYRTGWRADALVGSCVAAFGWFADKDGPQLRLHAAAQLRLVNAQKCRRDEISTEELGK